MLERFDRSKIRVKPLKERENKVSIKEIYSLDSEIPEYENPDLDALTEEIFAARKNGKQIIWMMGAHPIRRGNSRFIIDLMERGIITHVATSGAGAIHDLELAMVGATCENVERYIKRGEFGNWDETAQIINQAAIKANQNDLGFGEMLGGMICLTKSFPNQDISIFANAYKLMIPITIHKGIGFDITDQHPSADYAAIGEASGTDFLVFANSISKLVEEGGVYLNFGSAVMGPEVYLKALSMARNVALGKGKKLQSFVTANFDIVKIIDWKDKDTEEGYYYRPQKTILERTVRDGGKSFHIQGDFRITIPNLYKRLTRR